MNEQAEYRQLRRAVALMTHLVDPHEEEKADALTLAELEAGLVEQCVQRVDAADAEITRLLAMKADDEVVAIQWLHERNALREEVAAYRAKEKAKRRDARERLDRFLESAERLERIAKAGPPRMTLRTLFRLTWNVVRGVPNGRVDL